MLPNIKSELQTLYDGTAKVYIKGNDAVDEDGITRQRDEMLYESIPCRLSYKRKDSNEQSEVGVLNQIIVMICDTIYEIPSGSTIEFSQYGQVHTYKCSGLSAMYQNHQEIELITFEEHA